MDSQHSNTHLETANSMSQPEGDNKAPLIEASPYEWRDPLNIPKRPWIFGRWLLSGTVACVVAPGGVGKSTLLMSMALSLSSGRSFLGKAIFGDPKRVWLWNLEDDMDELSRSLQAAALHHGITYSDFEGRLFIDSAMEGATLCTAVETKAGFELLEPIYEALTAELTRRKIDVLFVDPFVSSHAVEENHNTKIDQIAKAWGRVAKAANCCIVLVHHTSKAGSNEVSAMSARGAVALINAARSTLVINRMEQKIAAQHGIADDEVRRYISVADDKHNRAPAEAADWFRLVPVSLGNGSGGNLDFGDSIAVIESFKLEKPSLEISDEDHNEILRVIAAGEWRDDIQAGAWVGKAFAEVLKVDLGDKREKATIKWMKAQWLKNGLLVVVEKRDEKRVKKKFIEVAKQEKCAAP
jgi:hypothetical protein